MKRLISAVLALSLLGATAASAAPYGHGDQGRNTGYSDQYRGDGYRGRGGDNSGAIIAGVGFLTLVAILASQHHNHYRQGYNNYGDQYRRDNGYERDQRYGNGDYNNGYGYQRNR